MLLPLGLWLFLVYTVRSEWCTTQRPIIEPDFYWRDFFGEIPYDAVPGGIDSNGKTSYIGQSFYREFELLPATIYQGSGFAVSTAHQSEIRTDKNTKILCSPNAQDFVWVKVNTNISHIITQCQQVIGGAEINHVLTIGRVFNQGSLVTGKVFPDTINGKGLWIHSNGVPVNFQTFELLSYNCIY